MCLHKDVAEEHKKAKVQSSKIERDLHKHASMENNVVKILMLGIYSYMYQLYIFSHVLAN